MAIIKVLAKPRKTAHNQSTKAQSKFEFHLELLSCLLYYVKLFVFPSSKLGGGYQSGQSTPAPPEDYHRKFTPVDN